MQIHNVRLGLATNSSSSHSLIFLPNAEDALLDEGGSFGWEPFMAASAGQKNRYVALTLYTAMARLTTPEIARLIVKEWSGIALEEVYPGEVNGFVDHQSVYDLPTDWAGKVIDHEFFEDFRGFFLREGLVILGGNDNDGRHPLDGKDSFRLPLNQDCHPGDVVCRKDPDGWWTTFNRKTGAKIRLSFAEGKTVTPMKSHAPELCDVKVTDYCAAGCTFCYQDSTVAGTHADECKLQDLAYSLGRMKVFEVAIGGGEPTTHPAIAKILESFRHNGIVPNMTTKSLSWLGQGQARRREAILESLGAFAYSIDTAEDMDKLVEACTTAERNQWEIMQKVHVQYVMGSRPLSEFRGILERANTHNLTLTLLGFKRVGRGETFAPHPYEGWLDIAVEMKAKGKLPPHFGIDTALAAESGPALKAAGVPHWCYATEEGKFSMYIDAVAAKMGPSSYCEPLRMTPCPIGYGVEAAITEAFPKW